MYEQRPPSAALVIAGLALLLVVSGLLFRTALPRWTAPTPYPAAAYPALAVAASALPTIPLPSTEPITTPPQPYLAPGEMVPTPTATPPPRWAALSGGVMTLPTDRLWALAPLPYGEACDRNSSALLAASPTGDVAWLRSAVFQSLPRGITPPLVVTCAPGGVYGIADPQTAQAWALPPETGPEPYSFTLSLDGQQVAWLTPAGYDQGTGSGMFGYVGGRLGREVQVLDLATGTLRTFSGRQLPRMRESTYTTLRGWGVGGIVIDVFTGPDGGTWQLDPQAARPAAARLDTPTNQSSQINVATGHMVYWHEREQALVLRDLQTGSEQVLAQAPTDDPSIVPIHADFSPDGQTLVFARPALMPDGAVRANLVLRDVRSGAEQIIVPELSLPAGARWAFGGQALVLVTSTPIINGATVAHGTIVLDRAGNVLGSVPSEPHLPPYVLPTDGQPLVVGSTFQNTTLVVDPGAFVASSPPTITETQAELIYLPPP